MNELSVSELAEISGLTVRTLRYYDKIGLLKPHRQTDNNYRVYTNEDCLKLQQILLYRELEIPLETIRELLHNEEHETISALKEHSDKLLKRQQRTSAILQTVKNTIQALENKNKIMDYKDLYKGFSKEEAEKLVAEAKEKWGDQTISASIEKLVKHTKQEWENLLKEGEDITAEIALRNYLPCDERSVQEWIYKHYRHIGRHFDVTKEIYSNMGEMYAEDERFRAYYEKFAPGFADFMNKAIQHFCSS